MPHASSPETPPSTAPTSPTSPTDDFIDLEKGSVDEDDDEEIIEEVNEKVSDIPLKHRKEDGRRILIQRSKASIHT